MQVPFLVHCLINHRTRYNQHKHGCKSKQHISGLFLHFFNSSCFFTADSDVVISVSACLPFFFTCPVCPCSNSLSRQLCHNHFSFQIKKILKAIITSSIFTLNIQLLLCYKILMCVKHR